MMNRKSGKSAAPVWMDADGTPNGGYRSMKDDRRSVAIGCVVMAIGVSLPLVAYALARWVVPV